MKTKYSARDLILKAAYDLHARAESSFLASKLVVTAWQLDTQVFGLEGYVIEYPDSNCVLAALMGANGLVARGLLAKVKAKTYELTEAGRWRVERVFRLKEGKEAVDVLSTHAALAARVLFTQTDAKWLQRRFIFEPDVAFVVWSDAATFWNLADATAIDICLDAFVERLRIIADNIGPAGETILPDGRSVTAADVHRLLDVSGQLVLKFKREITRLRHKEKVA